MTVNSLVVRIEPLSENHNRVVFSCGDESLDRYLQTQAGQDARRRVAITFVMVAEESPDDVMGYYTLSSSAIDLGQLPPAIRKKLPPYPLVPATLIGRLARHGHYRGAGIGEHLLLDALNRSLEQSKQIASFAVVVDAINPRVHAWYAEKWGFIPFAERHDRLYLPMKTIEKLF